MFDLTNFVFELMLDGAMSQMGIEDRDAGWKIVKQRLDRLGKVRDEGRFVLSMEEAHS